MASDWNRLMERLLEADLTVGEYRLGIGLARLLLGWQRRSHRLGEALLRTTTGLHDRRSFERARAGLVAKGLIRYEPGRPGRGHGALYELLLAYETSAAERRFEASETGATERGFPAGNVRSQGTETCAPERRLRGSKGKTKAASRQNGNGHVLVRGSHGTTELEPDAPRLTREEQVERWLTGAGQAFDKDDARVILQDSFGLDGDELQAALERRRALAAERQPV